ncbi:hypothetical protein PR202_gb05694 [Eleusine coracana subsp. coracana]|uniref:F-box/LRR-repeat protein 15/At3g58940/PEG3-like LRR domain-containing protein n=1 Tax=Eleusine coracana subsp. coracana TaxID=191504 RepID=A0AAV5E540_ELECO|nr:hypothetical protein PR202_gb05694 [Eleusine coracana subsp. coracana]
MVLLHGGPHQQPPRGGAVQHRVVPPRQGRCTHRRALQALAPQAQGLHAACMPLSSMTPTSSTSPPTSGPAPLPCPSTDSLSLTRPAVFPHLCEIGLCHVDFNTADINHLLPCRPVLEKLAFVHNYFNPFHVRIRSRGLHPGSYLHIKVRIGYATKLKVLGYREASINQLMIGSTIIESGTKMSPSTMVPSVSILALKVRSGVRKKAKILLTFLRCFLNTKTLHIMV